MMSDITPVSSGRPLSAERENALLDAALAVLGEVGYDRLTVAAVCDRAGASTKTAYRRWANKDELLAVALRRAVDREVQGTDPLVHADTLREALVANLRAQASSYRASPNLVIGLIVASRIDGDLGAVAREIIAHHETRYSAALLAAAAERGEVTADVDPALVADTARAFFLHEVIVRDAPPSAERIDAFVDRILLPLCESR